MFRSHENVTLRRNNITFRRANIKSRRNNWKSQCKNMFPQRENITPQSKKIFPQRENITQQRKNIISQCKNIIPQQENKNFQIRLMKNQRSLQYSQIFDWKTDFLALRTTEKVFVSVRATANQKWKYKPHWAKMLFQISKLLKKGIWKAFCGYC